MPRLSILIPAYNADKFIAKTIQSVLQQTYTNWELIILDDCSTDTTFQIAKQFESQYPAKIKIIQNETNLGMMPNWNKGIDLCKSELFVKLDADDIWLPTFLEKSINSIDKNPTVGLVFTKYINIDEYDNIIPNSEITLPSFAIDKPFSTIPLVQLGQDKMLQYQILRQGLSVMRRNIFDKIGNYKYIQSSDTEFYFRVGLHFNIYCINESLYLYRIHQNSDSKRIEQEGLRPFLLYEIKNNIYNYYFEKNVIDKKFYNKNIKSTQFLYNSFLISKYRKQKEYRKMVTVFFQNLHNNTSPTVLFYWQRAKDKIFSNSNSSI